MLPQLLCLLLAQPCILLAHSKPIQSIGAKRQWGNWGRPTTSAAAAAAPPAESSAVAPPPATTPGLVPVSVITAAPPPPAGTTPAAESTAPALAPPASTAPASVPPVGAGGGEFHEIQLINNCGSGEAVFFYDADRNIAGPRTITGPLASGAAWLRGFGDCQDSGVNCGLVEFTLLNGGISSADYSLLDGPNLGNHKFTYAMNFAHTGACTNTPGPCTGPSPDQCPNAYWGSDTGGGVPLQCTGDNLGMVITFC
ncbi:hypothetical protein I316_02656 [Kwoniella heveanensis BCC8398]|uniref:Uncharacterized protein n=1 Tax=Kwoniella heveanensis BCC8398 TaxID=1296120 RepID=A0A1B9GX41_9TREE|nr:hypothetical protein I316_02656 [Kwoniella heveanensis BCC8398]